MNELGSSIRSTHAPVLITGHTGFKGTWLALLFDALNIPFIGYSLVADQDALFNKVTLKNMQENITADVTNYKLLKECIDSNQPSVIFHLAAQPLVLESYVNPLSTFNTNVIGTANILNIAFQTSAVKAVAAITTDKVYRNYEDSKSFKETDALGGKDPYSASKVGSEMAISAWQHIQELRGGPKVISLRAGNVIGGGDWAKNRIMPDLIRGFSSNEKVTIRNPTSTRPWQHVLDPLIGYILAAEASLNGSEILSWNFGPTEDSLDVRTVAAVASNRWPSPVEIDFQETKTTGEESTYLNLDSSLARSLLNWQPIWNQKQAVEATVDWWVGTKLNQITEDLACRRDIQALLDKYFDHSNEKN